MERHLKSKILKLLDLFPIVVILGVRQCGKSTLAKQCCPDWKYLDLQNPDTFDFISRDPTFFFRENPQSVILDEAQVYPELFKILRGVVDTKRKQTNRFLITGSSSYDLVKNVSESLAGRVAIVELSTFKASEIYEKPLSPFYEIFENKLNEKNLKFIQNISPTLNEEQIKKTFLTGGYPEPVLSQSSDFYKIWMENYFRTYIDRDVRALFPKLDLIKYRRLLNMLAQMNGQIINKADLARSVEVTQTTIKDYLDIAHGTFVWRQTFVTENLKNKNLIKMPKGQFRDSGLTHHLQHVFTLSDLDQNPHRGRNFEAFVCEEILKGMNTLLLGQFDYGYFRTRSGAEIDLMLVGAFGLLPIEIKLGQAVRTKDLTALTQFIERQNLPYGMVINQSETCEMLTSKIIQIPAKMI